MIAEDMTPDSTKELLTAHHAAVLRELDKIHVGVSEIGARTNQLERKVGVLSWAYGLGAAIMGWLAIQIGWKS